jgi:hypothetical protein
MNVRSRLAAVTLVAALAAASTHLIGCIGGGCGVGPVEGPNVQDGAVTFDDVPVGSAQQLPVAFQDSADTNETITGATLSGANASEFKVISAFPMAVPAGQQVTVQIEFAPTVEGAASATLTLETEKMGPSPVQLAGNGVAPGE